MTRCKCLPTQFYWSLSLIVFYIILAILRKNPLSCLTCSTRKASLSWRAGCTWRTLKTRRTSSTSGTILSNARSSCWAGRTWWSCITCLALKTKPNKWLLTNKREQSKTLLATAKELQLNKYHHSKQSQ